MSFGQQEADVVADEDTTTRQQQPSETSSEEDGSKNKKVVVGKKRDAIHILRQLRDDVVFLDGRLNNLTKNMDSDTNLQVKLKQMEEEKGETEQVLAGLRGKLEEHKRISYMKRQRLKERSSPSNSGNKNKATTDDDTLLKKTVTPDASPAKSLVDGLRDLDISAIPKEETVIEEFAPKSKDLTEKEVQELENKINALESQKEEMETTLLDLLKSYEDKTTVLQKEKQRLEDDKDTTYKEMKTLLIEQHAESERLRSRVSHLEAKRSKVKSFARNSMAVLFFVLMVAVFWLAIVVDDLSAFYGSRNHVCAPARPGTQISVMTGPVEAPWWAPRGLKGLIFPLICEDRPRLRMEFKRGHLVVTKLPGDIVLTKKLGNTAYIEAEKIHISDRGGGHKEIDAPWSSGADDSAT